jgi:hypothetical protein
MSGQYPALSEALAGNPGDQWITTTLPVAAEVAYSRFCQIEDIPLWLPIIRSVRAQQHGPGGLVTRASFQASLDNATIGYTLFYEYDGALLALRWATPPGSTIHLAGAAYFRPLGPKACLMGYALNLDRGELPAWRDPFFNNHATSAVLGHFRDYINRRFK